MFNFFGNTAELKLIAKLEAASESAGNVDLVSEFARSSDGGASRSTGVFVEGFQDGLK